MLNKYNRQPVGLYAGRRMLIIGYLTLYYGTLCKTFIMSYLSVYSLN